MTEVRTLNRVVTFDEADETLLSLANERGKFALSVGPMPAYIQEAFERGIDNQWFTLVDVGPVSAAPGHLMRVFRLTPAGVLRLADIRNEQRQ